MSYFIKKKMYYINAFKKKTYYVHILIFQQYGSDSNVQLAP